MLRKNHRPSSLTSWQVQQLKRVSYTLRRLNVEARRKLRRIRHTDLTRTKYREAGDFLGTIATQMTGALRSHHEISKAELEPRRFQLNVHFVTPCPHVRPSKSRDLGAPDNDEAEREVLKQDSAHQVEIESLLHLTNSIDVLVSRRSILRGGLPKEFFRGINRFRLVVLQQRQHLLATSPRPKLQFELNVADGPDICTECLKSKEIDGTMESCDRQL
jgi:hypothetical protein